MAQEWLPLSWPCCCSCFRLKSVEPSKRQCSVREVNPNQTKPKHDLLFGRWRWQIQHGNWWRCFCASQSWSILPAWSLQALPFWRQAAPSAWWHAECIQCWSHWERFGSLSPKPKNFRQSSDPTPTIYQRFRPDLQHRGDQSLLSGLNLLQKV